jgi:hypothetical protein
MEKIGANINFDAKVGGEFLWIEGPSVPQGIAFNLDGFKFRHVIFSNIRIIYNGGPAQLEDVLFVNCTFDIPQKPQGQSFAKEFTTTGPIKKFEVT